MYRKPIALALVFGALLLVGVLVPREAVAAEDLSPTVAELAHSRAVAVAYWKVPHPPCGVESVTLGEVPPTEAAQAIFGSCTIEFSTAVDWHDFPVQTCRVYVHEFGHLVLGPTYFASVNPADPLHSPDPNNIMYARPTVQQEERQERNVGCLSPLVVKHPKKAHHRRKHKRQKHRKPPPVGLG